MFFAITTLFTALAMATVAAWFAIAGIMAIFAGMPIYAMIMGIVVEAGKVVGVTWIYRNWLEKTKLKFVMIPVVIVAMLLTSMGIFGLLSKAHLEQTAPVSNNTAKIERLDQRIARERSEIADAETEIGQLDETLQVLIDANIISDPIRGARVVRENQKPQRDFLKEVIDESEDSIDEFEDEKLLLNQELNELELEVGPVKYLAAIIYEEPENNIEEAVRIVIIAFIFVFDPMAILLLMGANHSLMQVRGKGILPDQTDPDDDDDPEEEATGEDLINLIDDEDEIEPIEQEVHVVEKSTTPVEKVQVTLDNGLRNAPSRAWMKNIPSNDEDIDTKTLLSVIRKLRHRDKTKEEQELLERFKGLAASRNVPWDIASRASVSTQNDLLKQ